jgi:hypothetical protein
LSVFCCLLSVVCCLLFDIYNISSANIPNMRLRF